MQFFCFFPPCDFKSFLRNDWQLDFQFHRFQREIKFLLVEPCILHELMHFICYAIFLLLEHIFSRILSVCLFIFSVTLIFCCCCLSQLLIIIGQLIPLVRYRKFIITSDSSFVKTKSLKKMWEIDLALHKNQIKWVPLNGLCT